MMKGASTACQSPGRPGGLGGGLRGRFRLAREYSLVSVVESNPILGSIWRILMPDQKLPKASQGCPLSSITKLGSIALKSSSRRESRTSPWSTQWKLGLAGFSVLLVSRAIPDVFLPKTENA